ncbi:MAG: biotin carboxylase, partial [Flammeovirgaceae bacterium]|nr:biotin carboxylase [Flammeovirgaceae bacterium]MDW8288712.1 biotin carboxylase [Flammeovirgaceae bacterium]
PVTEMITGVDLVREMIRIAEGEPLSFSQEDLKIKGHAIEIRVCAEDPSNNFLPDIGKLVTYRRPQGVGVRIDDGYEEGMDIPIYYDPMIAKLITYGTDRQQAIARMIRAIDEYQITGVQTTLGFCRYALQHPAFLDGSFDTKFVEKYFNPECLKTTLSEEEEKIAVSVAAYVLEKNKHVSAPPSNNNTFATKSAWKWRAKW